MGKGETVFPRLPLHEYVCLLLLVGLQTELHEVVYWLRQVLGVLCGVVWGVIPLTGYVGNLAYAPTDPASFFPSSWLGLLCCLLLRHHAVVCAGSWG